MTVEPLSKPATRALEFLAKYGEAQVQPMQPAGSGMSLLEGRNCAKAVFPDDAVAALLKADLVRREGDRCSPTQQGLMRLKRAKVVAGDDASAGFRRQHRDEERVSLAVRGEIEAVTRNINESPLHRLSSRPVRGGGPYLNAVEFEAGERLRADFTRGHLGQRVTASWDVSLSARPAKGSAGASQDISNSAIDARSRMASAMEVVGPELAGVLTDVCCFLKGLETVERDRKWPPRSAKLMLRTGLSLLARHYGLVAMGPDSRKTRHWGVQGYRPELV